ncbi:MAG: hypothetical protein LUE63_00680 [Lachnospiraceae bacterium]|nr:hypothetical protein [Lachnospiraceae bacterium]
MVEYTPAQWLMFFYLYCFMGWIFESCYVSILKKRWVNRGFLHLPLLPLYGSGAVLVLFVTIPFRDNLFLEYLSGAVAATILELVVGLSMEALYKVKYWDYSDKKCNFRGVMCLESFLWWGVLPLFLVEIAQNPLEQLVFAMVPWLLYLLDAGISAVFLYDVYISNRAALQLAHLITAMEKARAELRENLEDLELQLAEQRGRLEARVEYSREHAEARMEESRLLLEIQAELARESLEEFAGETMEDLGELTAEMRDRLARRSAEARQKWETRVAARWEELEDLADEARERLDAAAADSREALADLREAYEQKKEELLQLRQSYREDWKKQMQRAEMLSRGMIGRNPSAWSAGHEEIFKELRERSMKWRTRKKKSKETDAGEE